eukprot:358612-Chlamydomonas_euryale.AAC.5
MAGGHMPPWRSVLCEEKAGPGLLAALAQWALAGPGRDGLWLGQVAMNFGWARARWALAGPGRDGLWLGHGKTGAGQECPLRRLYAGVLRGLTQGPCCGEVFGVCACALHLLRVDGRGDGHWTAAFSAA